MSADMAADAERERREKQRAAFASEDRVCGNCGKTWSALAFWSPEMNCHDCNRFEYEVHLAKINEGRPYRVDSIGGACPTQAEGQWIDGQEFYFRARHGTWTLQVDPSYAVGGEYIATGDDPSAGFMSDADVVAILDKAASA